MPTRAGLVILIASIAGAVLSVSSSPAQDQTGDPPCATSAPSGGGPLRTDSFGSRQTVIAVGPNEVPQPVPEELDQYLKEQGAVLGERGKGERVRVKAAWFRNRHAAGRLKVTGKRLDESGGRFRASINRLYGGKKFSRVIPSKLLMSSTGCWRYRARAGKARVKYVALIRYPHEGELEPFVDEVRD